MNNFEKIYKSIFMQINIIIQLLLKHSAKKEYNKLWDF